MPFEVHFACWRWLGRHVGGPWRCQGLGLGPGLARGHQNGLDCTRPGGSIVLLGSRDPGNGQSGGRFGTSGPYYQFKNCLIQGTFISELLDLRLRKVIKLLNFLLDAPPQPGGTLFEGPADYSMITYYIYMYIIRMS